MRILAAGVCGAAVLAAAASAAAQTSSTAAPAKQAGAKAAAPAQAPAAPAADQPPAPSAGAAGQRGRGLALSDEQKTRVRALREQQRTELRAVRDGMRTAREKLRDLRAAATFDEAAFRAAAGAVASAQADLMVLRARHRAQFLGLLTPEQRERVRVLQVRAARRARTGQMVPGGRERGMGPGRGGWMGGPEMGRCRGWDRDPLLDPDELSEPDLPPWRR